MEHALLKADEGQADCFWHDHSVSMRYLLVLHGVARLESCPTPTSVLCQTAGRVNESTMAYRYLASKEPQLLPGETGPLSIILVL